MLQIRTHSATPVTPYQLISPRQYARLTEYAEDLRVTQSGFTAEKSNRCDLLEFSQKAAMASTTPKPNSNPRSEASKPSGRSARRTTPLSNNPPEAVDPIWLLKAIGVTILAALICGYLTLCLLFYQGQWQLVLHPSRITPAPASIAGTPFQIVHFGVDETATPQLAGWFIPVEPTARYAAYTVLYLPGGDGSLAGAIPTLAALHRIGINVFAFDYRGYGQSAATRPNQKHMAEDVASAWAYLTVSRALPPSRIVLFGNGVGASLAVQLAAAHSDSPAVIIDSPIPDPIQVVLADPRVKSLPVRALFNQNFEIAAPISNLQIPKLFLLNTDIQSPGATASEIGQLTSAAASPKMVSNLHAADFAGALYQEQIVRFLDQYLR